MCPPDYFRVEYAINPWMRPETCSVDSRRARAEWSRLRDVMEIVAEVELLAPSADLPDMVFTANSGFVLGNSVLLARYRHPERRGEVPHVRRYFSDRGYTIHELPAEVCFEGTGDAILDRGGEWIWAGHGFRSDPDAHDVLARCFQLDVVSLHLIDARFYHLDTCLAPLTGGYLMYYPGAFDAPSLSAIEDRVPSERRIVVDEADAATFACNAVNVGKTIIAHALSAGLRERLLRIGFSVEVIPLDEFVKAGGAAFCMMLRLEDERNRPARVKR